MLYVRFIKQRVRFTSQRVRFTSQCVRVPLHYACVSPVSHLRTRYPSTRISRWRSCDTSSPRTSRSAEVTRLFTIDLRYDSDISA